MLIQMITCDEINIFTNLPGSVVAKLHETSTNFKLAPGASDTISATLKSSVYLPKTRNNNNSIKFFALGGVKNPTGGVLQSFAFNDWVEIEKPKLNLKVRPYIQCIGITKQERLMLDGSIFRFKV